MRTVHWVSKSSDVKTGPVLASYSPLSSCPDSCTFKDGGCYAWGLFYLKILGKKIESGKIQSKPLAEALKARSKACRIVRHRVAGDVVGDVQETLLECNTAKEEGLVNIGYTHHWRSDEAQPLKHIFRASCNTMDDIAEATKMGWSTTVAVHGSEIPKQIKTESLRFISCPARHGIAGKKDITCNDCTLCKVDDKTKDVVVMFEVHGAVKTIRDARGKSVDITDIIAQG